MTSDSDRQAAEEAYRDTYGISPKENPEFDIFESGFFAGLNRSKTIPSERLIPVDTKELQRLLDEKIESELSGKNGGARMADLERKAAHEYHTATREYALARIGCLHAGVLELREKDFLAGRSSALKELEQVAREAFEYAFQKGAEAQDAIEASECTFADSEGMFQDYWQKKTESKEAE